MRNFSAILIAALAISAAALAATPDERAREREIAEAASRLGELTAELRGAGVDDPRRFEQDIRDLVAGSRDRLAPVEEQLRRTEERIALLGPAPKEGDPPEASTVASERRQLNSEIVSLRGQRTRIVANMDAATALLDEYSAQRLEERYRRIARRGPPLVSPDLWSSAAQEAGALARAVGSHFSSWRAAQGEGGGFLVSIAGLVAALLASFMMFGPVSAWLRRVFSVRIEAQEPTHARRVALAGIKMLTRIIPGVAGGLLVIETSRALGLVGEAGVPVVRAMWQALIAYLLVDGFARGLFAPQAPAWRLADVQSARTRFAFGLLLWIVMAVGMKIVASALIVEGADALRRVVNGASAMAVGALVFTLCRKSVWVAAPSAPEAAEAPAGAAGAETAEVKDKWGFVRFAGRFAAFIMLAAPLAGYVGIADFAASRLYYLILILTIFWFVRASLKELTAWADQRLRNVRDGAAADETHAFQFWVGAGIDLVLLLAAAPLAFILAGVNAEIVRDYILRALVGFRIGDLTFSLFDILLAIAAFVGILALTRLFQSAMQRGPFAHSRIDPGIQNSLTTLFGYVGLVLAAVVALGMLGFNLTSLALIAGALSVGIGFGLQSIVNNFVSGIILLFERPVKVGDWIVTTSGEGIVKKISVRSTVLETFDRASVIIPNSELIASTVTNWTHKSALGRIRVPVGVSYDSDPDLVRELLLKCADDHPLVVRYPEPFVVWMDFGASSLDFELRAFISDIARGLQVRTDLRFAIFRAFRERGVEIPFPQQDIHIKTTAPSAPARRSAPAVAPETPAHEPDEANAPDD